MVLRLYILKNAYQNVTATLGKSHLKQHCNGRLMAGCVTLQTLTLSITNFVLFMILLEEPCAFS